jgi:hypothetical protein
VGGTWQPIETAPRDGTWILGLYVDRPRVIKWRSGKSTKRYESSVTVWFWSDGYFRPGEPVAWAELPSPPSVACADLPPPKPKPILVERKLRKPLVEVGRPRRRVLMRETVDVERVWCSQCERNVTLIEARQCDSPFCKAKVEAA